MTEKELIKLALESRLPDSMGRPSSEIIEAEARGAQAHIRRRRFAFVGVAAAAALLIGASVFGLNRLSRLETEPPAADSSVSSKAEDKETDGGRVIKLCDFTGKQEAQNITVIRTPSNMDGKEVSIGDRSVSVDGREIFGLTQMSALIKVFSADVTGDGNADICIESKPAFNDEASAVYMYDLENELAQIYYIPDRLSFTLTEEKDTLKLGMRLPNSHDTEYVPADFTVPERYSIAKLDWLKEMLKKAESSTGYTRLNYSSRPYGTGKSYIGDDVSCFSSLFLSKFADPEVEAPAKLISSVCGSGEITPYDQPVDITTSHSAFCDYVNGVTDETNGGDYLEMHFSGYNSSGDSMTLISSDMYSGQRAISVTVTDKYNNNYVMGFTMPQDGAESLRSMVGKADSAELYTNYYCRDISALDNTSPAPRMLVSQKGSFAIAYHIETKDGRMFFVTDSVQPTGLEGELSVTAAEGKSEFAVGFGWTELPDGQELLADGFQVSFSTSESDISHETVSDNYIFGEEGFDKKFVYLADFTRSSTVTRLDTGEQIRFEKRVGAFPDVTVSMTDDSVTVNVDGGPHLVTKGMKVSRVFASDVNSDGKPEVIAEVFREDKTVDGDVLVYDVVSDKLISLAESFYGTTGLWVDSVRSYLAVQRPDKANGTRPFAQDVALDRVIMSMDTEGLENYALQQMKKLKELSENDPSSVKYDLLLTNDNSSHYSSVSGDLLEARQLASIITDSIESKRCQVLTVDDVYTSIDKDFYFNVRSDDLYFTMMYVSGEGYYYVPSETAFADAGLISVIRLDEDSSRWLLDITYDNEPAFKSITMDGTPYDEGIDGDSEKLEKKGFEFSSVKDAVTFKGRVKFDFPGKKLILYTDKTETAEGVSVEQSEIHLVLGPRDVNANSIEKTVILDEPLSDGAETEITFPTEADSEAVYLSAYLVFTFDLRLPDGTERQVYFTLYDNFNLG